MNPIKTVADLVTAKRRAAQQHAELIAVIRQTAALLSAGRPLVHLWSEVAQGHPACISPPAPDARDPKCCMHHVLQTQYTAGLLGEPYFAHITGPSSPTDWQQLSATVSLAQETGISLAATLYRLADALEAGEDAQQAREAASAGPRATANLLAWLPVAGLGLAHMLGASMAELLTTITGWVLVISGAGLALAGRRWSAHMIRTAQEP